MARMNIKTIENVEGKYHVMFFEGKNMVASATAELKHIFMSLLFFAFLVIAFIVFSGFNLYYLGFVGAFLVVFVAMCIYLLRQKKVGKKQCVYAVKNSHASEVIAKQIDNRKAGKALVKSMSSTLDKYDVKEKFPTFHQKLKRSKKHRHLVGVIKKFDEEKPQNIN